MSFILLNTVMGLQLLGAFLSFPDDISLDSSSLRQQHSGRPGRNRRYNDSRLVAALLSRQRSAALGDVQRLNALSWPSSCSPSSSGAAGWPAVTDNGPGSLADGRVLPGSSVTQD